MGTSAFDAAWDSVPDGSNALDAAYGSEGAKKPLTKAQIARLAISQAEKNSAEKIGAGEYFSNVLEAPATFAAGIPGAKLTASLISTLLPGGGTLQSAQNEINARTSGADLSGMSNTALRKVGRVASTIGNVAGSLALTPIMPTNAATAGMIFGGADQALNNDPGSGLLARIGRGTAGAVGGRYAGKYIDRAVTAVRGAMAPAADAARNQLLADRAVEAKALYDRALSEGQGKTMPQAVRDWLATPDIAGIVAELKATRVHKNTPIDSPEMLDAIYKNLSDKGLVAKSKLAALVPRNANLGRIAQKDIALAKQEGLDAMSGGYNAPMPTYEQAVARFNRASQGIDAFDTGFNAVRSEATGSLPSAKNLSRADKTNLSLWDWISGSSVHPMDREMAARGALGAIKQGKFNRNVLDATSRVMGRIDKSRGVVMPQAAKMLSLYGVSGIPRGLFSFLAGPSDPNQP